MFLVTFAECNRVYKKTYNLRVNTVIFESNGIRVTVTSLRGNTLL